jgi:RimJ/RimL family protein N-acetyltransferase
MDFAGFRGKTARMRLRPYSLDDYAEFADLHGRDDVARFLPWETRDGEAARAALQHHQALRLEADGDGVTLAGFDKETGRLVGEFVLFLRSIEYRGGEVGYIVHPDFQGRGLATEGARAMLQIGFDTMGLHRIIARIDARNEASAAVLSRLGMRREALLIRNEWFKGEWGDEADYAMLESEWATASSQLSETRPATLSILSRRTTRTSSGGSTGYGSPV